MVNLKDLKFKDKAEFTVWVNERLDNAFKLLKKNRNIDLVFTSYQVGQSYDTFYINFKYYQKSNGHDFTDSLSLGEIHNLDTLSHWSCLLMIMPMEKWLQYKNTLSTNQYIELCLAGWFFAMYTKFF